MNQSTVLFRPIFASKRVHGLGVATKSRLSQDLVKKGEEMQTVDTMSDTSHQRQTFKPKLNTVCPITGRRKRYGTTRKKRKNANTSHQRQTFKPKLDTVFSITGKRRKYDTSHQRQTFKPKLNTVCAVHGSKKRRMSRREKKKK